MYLSKRKIDFTKKEKAYYLYTLNLKLAEMKKGANARLYDISTGEYVYLGEVVFIDSENGVGNFVNITNNTTIKIKKEEIFGVNKKYELLRRDFWITDDSEKLFYFFDNNYGNLFMDDKGKFNV